MDSKCQLSKSCVLAAITLNEKTTESDRVSSNISDVNQFRQRRVSYIYSHEYVTLCDKLPKVEGRASMTHSLIGAYGLLEKMRCINPRPARHEEVTLFHSEAYVECLQQLSNDDDDEKWQEEAEMFGLTYDCPAYPGVYEYATYVSGASVKAAQSLLMGICDVAINWQGGWHHAKRDEASGYCYINDIVIAILKLRKKYDRVLYVDIDLHHGDGVEDAFCATSKVMTVSFHKVSPGFFPGSGELKDIGMGTGKYYTVNVPLSDGIQNSKYVNTFNRVMAMVKESFAPDAIVCQCGADGLAEDPMSTFNLTPEGLAQCVTTLLDWDLPTLLLGGGGYHLANTSRCWALLTATALGETLSQEIPEHKFFTKYGPDYQLNIEAGNRPDKNSDKDIEAVLQTIKENFDHITEK